MKLQATLSDAQSGHATWCAMWPQVKASLLAGNRLHAEVKTETRSIAQNSRMWSMLADLSKQVDWYGQKLTDEEWKDVLSASLKKQRAVPGIDGGFVILGQRTSKMTVAEMVELQDLIEAFGAQRGVAFRVHESEHA